MIKLLLKVVFLGGLILSGCGEDTREPIVQTVTDSEAEDLAERIEMEMSPTVAEGFDVSLWASEDLLNDAIGLDVDDLGRVYVSITERRRTSEIDIRGHSDWMIESITLETDEDKKEFLHRKLAPENSDQNEWITDFNGDGSHDYRDLAVNKESVLRLEDTSGNGHANQSIELIRDFHKVNTDVAGAVLFHGGDLFLGVSPDMWRIRDTNGDGYWDQKESIAHGFGTNIGFGGHGMSGLTTGPDGRIYWSIGDVGMSVVDQNGKRWHYPRQGVIVRSETDGSNFEVFAAGLRNTHEFVFDKYGNLITVDNDGDHAGEHERLVYLVNGSDSGWRLNWQFGKYGDPKNNDYKVLMDEEYFKPRFENQAAHILPPLDSYESGHSGVAYNSGTALSEKYRDTFFIGKFVGSPANSGIHAFTLEEDGAAFSLKSEQQILEGLLPTSLDFGPDGSLYFPDWIEGWALKQKGRIWKLDSQSSDETYRSLRQETETLLADDFSDESANRLRDLLQHADMRVRQKSQFELASRDDTDALLESISQTGHQLARIHGIWGVAQVARRSTGAAELLIPYLKDEDSEIRAQSAKMLGDVRYEPAAEALIPLLEDEQLRVRFFATEALGRLAWEPAFVPIINMLEDNKDEDVYLRHGGAIALERLGNEEKLMALSDHSSKAVRIAAVVALNRLESPGVIEFLSDDDEFIVTNAARAINDDTMIEDGLDELSAFLNQDSFMNEPLLRRAINASLYLGTQDAADRLTAFSLSRDVPVELRVEALETLAVWPEPSLLDRVTGDPRGVVKNDPELAVQVVEPNFEEILTDGDPQIRISALNAASGLKLTSAISMILPLLQHDPSPDVRIASLQTLATLSYDDIENAVYLALDDENDRVRGRALESVPGLEIPPESKAAIMGSVLESGTVEERQVAYQILGTMKSAEANSILSAQMDMLISDDLDSEVELDLVLAAESSDGSSVNEKLRLYQAEKDRSDSVSVYRELLYGGSADSGRRVFYRNAAAQCIRCHVVDGNGSNVGPDLSDVGNKLSRRQLLESMVNPGARIAPGYGSVTLTLSDGSIVRGMLTAESASRITIENRDGERVVDKTDIEERKNSPSGMPAMGNILSRDELRDLVEFLATLDGGSE
ncbi:HEAT repeat domain-containing protein [Rhodohalobacter sp. 8-1]|uniref:HEAT repeat domain-containing protein n=1 Tax=Rhodohalobacter sp. 8-1 TaxID=3131972 RepID=UPI0030ED3535